MKTGAFYYEPNSCVFALWAPNAVKAEINIVSPNPQNIPMTKADNGYWTKTLKIYRKKLFIFIH